MQVVLNGHLPDVVYHIFETSIQTMMFSQKIKHLKNSLLVSLFVTLRVERIDTTKFLYLFQREVKRKITMNRAICTAIIQIPIESTSNITRRIDCIIRLQFVIFLFMQRGRNIPRTGVALDGHVHNHTNQNRDSHWVIVEIIDLWKEIDCNHTYQNNQPVCHLMTD